MKKVWTVTASMFFVLIPNKGGRGCRKKALRFEMDQILLRRKRMADILITLIPVSCMAVYFYGVRVLVMLAFAVLTGAAADLISRLFLRQKWEKYDFSAIVTAVVFTLILPATAPYWMVALGVALAIFVAKAPFGGYGKNIFNPAAFSAAFMVMTWPDIMLRYPSVFSHIGLEATPDVTLNHSANYYLLIGGKPNINLMDALLGNFSGPIGATCILVICACGLYLLVRRTMSWQLPLGAFSVVLIWSVIFQRVGTSWIQSITYELISGVLVFGVIFMASDPQTTPRTGGGKLFFGILLGLVTMLFRSFGASELSFVFALLLANALSELCDVVGIHVFGHSKQKNRIAVLPAADDMEQTEE